MLSLRQQLHKQIIVQAFEKKHDKCVFVYFKLPVLFIFCFSTDVKDQQNYILKLSNKQITSAVLYIHSI
jgi:hypothetical protein